MKRPHRFLTNLFFSRPLTLVVLALAPLWATRLAAEDIAGLSSELADCNLTLRMAPTPAFKGLAMTIPVEVREFRPRTQADADPIAGLLPTSGEMKSGWQWDFSHGFGQLLPKGGTIPCRVFVMGIDPLLEPAVRAKIQSAAPFVYHDPRFQSVIGCLGAATFQTQSSDLTSVFPGIPLSLGPPTVGTCLKLVGCHSSSPSPEVTGTFVLDGSAAAFQRGLAVLGLSLDNPPLPKPPAHWVDDAKGVLDDAKEDVEKFMLWLGSIPAPATVLDLHKELSVNVTASTNYRLRPLPLAAPDGTVDVIGCALPAEQSNRMDIYCSAVPLPHKGEVRSALIQLVIRGWRWRQILTAPTGPTAQTLLRLNEPLFEYICLSTAEYAMSPVHKPFTKKPPPRLDAIGEALIAARVGDARAQATAPSGARSLYSAWPHGKRRDSFYPCCEPLHDYTMNKLFVTAMDGGLGIDAYLRRSRPKDPKKIEESIKAAQSSIAKGLVELVASGYHRPSRQVPLTDALKTHGDRGSWSGPDPSLEPDLVWLAGATTGATTTAGATTTGTDGAFEHPFAALDGTRTQKTLAALSAAGVQAVVWTQPPTFEPETHFCLVTGETLEPFLSMLDLMDWKYAASGEKSQQVKNDGRAESYSDVWWASSPYSQSSTPGDVETFTYFNLKTKLDTQIKTLRTLITTQQASFECMAFQGDLDGKQGPVLTPTVNTSASSAVATAIALNVQAIAKLDPNPGKMTALFATRMLRWAFVGPDRLVQEGWGKLLLGPGRDSTPPADPVALLKLILTTLATAGNGRVTLTTTGGDVVLR